MNRDDDDPEPAEAPEPTSEAPVDEDETLSGRARVLKFAKRLTNRRELAEDTRVLVSALLNTSDKAKTEAVKLMAREFRGYLRELRLKEDLLELMRSHSLEISIHLKPLPPGSSDDEGGEQG
jgi:hypothetical protein